MKNLIGNVYRNIITGNEWKIIKRKDSKITFEDMRGNRFDTVIEGTANYEYVGKQFTKKKNF